MDKLELRILSKKNGEANVLRHMLEEMESMLEDYLDEKSPNGSMPDWFDGWSLSLCQSVRESLKINQDLHKAA